MYACLREPHRTAAISITIADSARKTVRSVLQGDVLAVIINMPGRVIRLATAQFTLQRDKQLSALAHNVARRAAV